MTGVANLNACIVALRAECDAALRDLAEWKQAAAVEAGLRREFLTRAETAEGALATAHAEQIRLSLAVLVLTNERDEARALGRIA